MLPFNFGPVNKCYCHPCSFVFLNSFKTSCVFTSIVFWLWSELVDEYLNM